VHEEFQALDKPRHACQSGFEPVANALDPAVANQHMFRELSMRIASSPMSSPFFFSPVTLNIIL